MPEFVCLPSSALPLRFWDAGGFGDFLLTSRLYPVHRSQAEVFMPVSAPRFVHLWLEMVEYVLTL